jgi:hypothetical protein
MHLDRSCHCSRRYTKQLNQEDYEDINTGDYFEVEFKYSDILFVTGVTFLYSAGMPVLYPIAAAFFFVGYWFDKCLLLRHNRKPPMYNSFLARKSLAWHKWILLMHVVAGVIMFANSSICPSRYVMLSAVNDLLKQANSNWQVEDFFQEHILIFGGIMLGIAVLYLLWAIVVRSVKYCCKLCNSSIADALDKEVFEENYQWDFYDCISFKTLLNEFHSCLEIIKQIRTSQQTGQWAFGPEGGLPPANYQVDEYL